MKHPNMADLNPEAIKRLINEDGGAGGPLTCVFTESFAEIFTVTRTCKLCGSIYTRAGNLGGACPGNKGSKDNPLEGGNHDNERHGRLFIPNALLPLVRAAGSNLNNGVEETISNKTYGEMVRGLVFW